MRVRSLLVLLAMICAILPAALVLLAIDGQTKRATLDHDRALGKAAAGEISATVRGVDRELRSAAALLAAVPASEGMTTGMVDALQASDRDLLQVAYFDAAGRHVATVPRMRGLSLPLPRNPGALIVSAGGGAAASYFVLSVPVSGQHSGILVGAVSAEHDFHHLDLLAEHIGAQVAVVDGRRTVSLTTQNGPLPAGFATELRAGHHVFVHPGSFPAGISYLSEASVSGTSWKVLIAHPGAGLLSPRLPLALAVGTALFALLMALASTLILRRLSIASVRRRFEHLASVVPSPPSSGHAAELLLRETHHRVKNDLQMLSSLFSLSDSPGLRQEDHEVLVESKNRVQAISLIHELLYKSPDLATVNIRGYLTELVRGIEKSLVSRRNPITIVTRFGDYSFDTDTAVVCGLLLNEILTNSLKHAFPRGQTGLIRVRFNRMRGNRYRLEVRDDGVGLPAGNQGKNEGSLGLRIVRELADQLGGRLAVDGSEGTLWRVEFSAKEVALGA